MKFFIKTFGCQYNEWDSARLSFVLKKSGFEETIEKEDADVVFVLNCSVRKTGVDRALGFAENAKKRDQKIIVAGCVLKNDKVRFQAKGADFWDCTSTDELKKILGDQIDLKEINALFGKSQAASNYIPITKGCNNFCSYCAVPYTRGREISRPVEEIISNVKKVVVAGYNEFWLLGQNVNSYRGELDNDQKIGFSELLKLVNEIPGDFLINFTSSHPKDMTEEIIRAVADLPKVKKIIHLPLQSGSNKILKAMNRPYTIEQYLALIAKIKNIIPNIRLTTDTIVGFPGEDENDFTETEHILKEVEYYQVYNNKYSPREGTDAFQLGDPVPWAEKERRWRILNNISNKSRDKSK